MLTATLAPEERRRGQMLMVIAVVSVVIGMFVLTTDAGWQGSFLFSGFTALIFLPSFIAGMRLHRDRWAIFGCNVLMLGILFASVETPPLFFLILPGVALTWAATMIWSLATGLRVWLAVLNRLR